MHNTGRFNKYVTDDHRVPFVLTVKVSRTEMNHVDFRATGICVIPWLSVENAADDSSKEILTMIIYCMFVSSISISNA